MTDSEQKVLWQSKMTDGEQKVFWRGVAAGTLTGIAIGLIIALFIVIS
jgi:hypothetical protein